ncbi:MAG: hypothetical protein EOP06_07305 [Proteobacteria bacterium]|nr:MAG: hypothetical protein EOP06_07305 [Pseudomonadota bacterium]
MSEQVRTEQQCTGIQENLDNYLFYFHKHRWAQIAADIRHRIRNAPDDEARAVVKAELDAHYETQFHPETSREVLLAESNKADFVLNIREVPPDL